MSSEMTEERMASIYKEIEGMSVELDPDPILHGPEVLQRKTAEAQNYLSRLERIVTQLQHEFFTKQRQLISKNKAIELETKHLIATDERVKSGSSIKDRIAKAHVILNEKVEEVNDLDIQIQTYEFVLGTLKAKRAELKNLQLRIKDQFRIVQEEINLGASWGRPRSPYAEVTREDGDKVSNSLAEMDAILDDGSGFEDRHVEDLLNDIDLDSLKI